MATDLKMHLDGLRVADTHEHLMAEKTWVEAGPPDVLSDLFWHYAQKDLISAGAAEGSIKRVVAAEGDLEERWRAIEPAWQAISLTGYGEAVRIVARDVYGIEELSAPALRNAQAKLTDLRRPGERHRFLRDVCQYDHVQINQYMFPDPWDGSDPTFFFYDLSYAAPSSGRVPRDHFTPLGLEVTDLASMQRATEAYFARYAPRAIAVKTQHAYERTLDWKPRSDAEAEAALASVLRGDATDEDKLCLGDWCLARGVELAIAYDLPIKIHTGYYWNNNVMPMSRIRPSLLCPLLIRYPQARFVLMHAGYPYGHEIPAMVKHFSNVYADLCWAWSMDPYMTMDVVRRFIHSAPINKLMAFGGDTHTCTASYGYLQQMKKWLRRTLELEIAAGDLSESQAISISTAVLHDNAMRVFKVPQKKAAMAATESIK